jgi:hypothetical protein
MPIVPRIDRGPLFPESVEARVAKLAVMWAREGVLDTIDPSMSSPYIRS